MWIRGRRKGRSDEEAEGGGATRRRLKTHRGEVGIGTCSYGCLLARRRKPVDSQSLLKHMDGSVPQFEAPVPGCNRKHLPQAKVSLPGSLKPNPPPLFASPTLHPSPALPP